MIKVPEVCLPFCLLYRLLYLWLSWHPVCALVCHHCADIKARPDIRDTFNNSFRVDLDTNCERGTETTKTCNVPRLQDRCIFSHVKFYAERIGYPGRHYIEGFRRDCGKAEYTRDGCHPFSTNSKFYMDGAIQSMSNMIVHSPYAGKTCYCKDDRCHPECSGLFVVDTFCFHAWFLILLIIIFLLLLGLSICIALKVSKKSRRTSKT